MKTQTIDHGNYVPAPPCGGFRIEDRESVRKVFLISDSDTALPASAWTVGEGSSLDLTVMVLPGVSARIPLTFDIVGEGAEIVLKGIFLCKDQDEVTFDVTMNHLVGGCRSRQTFNGLAAGEARCGFFGRIVVAPDAQKTEAYQENHNILLSESAKVETKPRLEIYADDVKCSHGASVGRLDEEEQFYMRSRGIPEDEAKVLQMISFVAPVLEGLPEETVGTVEQAIRSL